MKGRALTRTSGATLKVSHFSLPFGESSSPDTGELIVENLLEAGEFSIDLYTMPDSLTTKLWDFFVSKPPLYPMTLLVDSGLTNCMSGQEGTRDLGRRSRGVDVNT